MRARSFMWTRRSIWLLFGAVFAFLLCFPVNGFCENGHKPTCAVLTFHPDVASTQQYESRYITNRYSTLLSQLDLYDVLPPAKVNEKLTEKKWQMIDTCKDKKCAVEAGRILGVDFVIYGVLGHIGNMYSMTTTLLDVKNATVVNTAVTDFEGNRNDFAQQAPPRNIHTLLGIKTIPSEWSESSQAQPEEPAQPAKKTTEKALHIGPRVGLGYSNHNLEVGVGAEARFKNASLKFMVNREGFAGALSYYLVPEGNSPYASLVAAYYRDKARHREIGRIYGAQVGYRIYLRENIDLCVALGAGYLNWDQTHPNVYGVEEHGNKVIFLGEFSIGYMF